jgi:pyruvate formate lyase activating enzyme
MGLWVEIVTLLIPGFNDSDDELQRLTEFVAGVSVEIPWHVTAFHKDYKMTDPADTKPKDLLRATAHGKRAGLRYVYAGNLPGRVGSHEDTHCHHCGTTLIQRFSYQIVDYCITSEGKCPNCSASVPGRWAPAFGGQITARPFLPHRTSGLVTIQNRR